MDKPTEIDADLANSNADAAAQNTDRGDVSSAGGIAKSSAAGVLSQVLYLGTRFLLTPFVLAKIGLEAYGFWSILFVALGWFGLHRMGFTSSAISYIAQYRAAGRNDRVNAVLQTTATLGLFLCLAMGGLLLIFANKIVFVLGTTPELYTEAVLAFQITVLATFAALVFGGYQSTLEALQQYPRVKMVDASALMLEAVLIIGFLIFGGGLASLSLAYAIRMVAPIPVYAYYARREIPGLKAMPGRLDRTIAADIFKFGGSIQLLGIIHLMITSLERLSLAHLAGLAAAGSYELGRKLVTLAAALPTHALAPLVPAAADLRGRAEKHAEQLSGLLRTTTRAVAIAAAAPLAFLVAMAPEIVTAWLGEGHTQVIWTLRILSISAYIHLTTGPATSILRGLAQPRLELMYTVVWLIVGAALIPLAAMHYGIVGVATGAAIAQAAASTLLLVLALPKLGVPRDALLRDVVGPAASALGWAMVCAFLLAGDAAGTARSYLVAEVIVGAGIVGLGATATSFLLILDPSEREAIEQFARKLVSRRTNPTAAEASSA